MLKNAESFYILYLRVQNYDYHFFDYHFFDKKLCLYLIIAYLCSRKGNYKG